MKYLIALLLLAGCATTRQYEDRLRAWEGKPAQSLIASWGTPTRTVDLADGGRMYMYYRKNQEELRVRRDTGSEGGSATEPLLDCKTEFLANAKDIIVSWKYEGHDCRLMVQQPRRSSNRTSIDRDR